MTKWMLFIFKFKQYLTSSFVCYLFTTGKQAEVIATAGSCVALIFEAGMHKKF